ncbi:hypothetical protein [Roseateles sp.]|uniref:hypothetical protein n=1 Tax=Roseateles sp. TaxID=1971397 RepID=UPI003262FEB9
MKLKFSEGVFECIENPPQFFASLGNLHDATIISVARTAPGGVCFIIGDVFNNFVDFPEYPGEFGAAIILAGSTDCEWTVSASHLFGKKINDFEVFPAHSADAKYRLEIACHAMDRYVMNFDKAEIRIAR